MPSFKFVSAYPVYVITHPSSFKEIKFDFFSVTLEVTVPILEMPALTSKIFADRTFKPSKLK
ncbi:hypothetical protein ATZ36_13610 [Candidatus Endomicrobiellum trichonymphae]|uniref:Uncharacterized protein n=1 Tax=Endomicrobium trichonymphae TaxID=1408204 RepID=A0A1E5IMD7_ENDTX|nr:hypothetical protein ATZ36_13610 [Candidatus Endomicrobium trichonymphae]